MKDMLSEQDVRRLGVEVGKVLEDNIMPQLEAIHEEIGGIKGEIVDLKRRVTTVETTMVTKDYLDDKLADLRGEFHLKYR